MSTIRWAENFYTLSQPAQIALEAGDGSASQVDVAQIRARLNDATTAYWAGKYQEAIAAYEDVATMLTGLVSPGYGGGGRVPQPGRIPPRLFDGMLSASLELLNALPVVDPTPFAVPRIPINTKDLGPDLVEMSNLGLQSARLTTIRERSAAADVAMSRRYQAEGNTKAASLYLSRAKKASPSTVKDLLGSKARPGAAAAKRSAAAPRGQGASATSARDLPVDMWLHRSVGTMLGSEVKRFAWNAGESPPITKITESLYDGRKVLQGASALKQLAFDPSNLSDVALYLPHVYFYVVPLGLAQCYHALGDWQAAEGQYLAAASYQYLNAAIEAPYLWNQLATLYLDWGNSLFRSDNASAAMPIYERVIVHDKTVPSSPLYVAASLAPGAATGRATITHLDEIIQNRSAMAGEVELNPLIVATVIEVWQQLTKIMGGLDFWGYPTTTVPIWTFDYLQNVAVSFAQLAVSAERDFINYQDRADQGTLTRMQLQQGAQQAGAELSAAIQQAFAANAETTAYQDGVDLANQRAADASANATDYRNSSWHAAVVQAVGSQVGGGDTGDWEQLNNLSDQMVAGGSFSGSRATLAAAHQLAAAKINQQYEAATLDRQAQEMALAAKQAQQEQVAAQFREQAAWAGVTVSALRAFGAQQMLSGFDSQYFTPDVWKAMGQRMYGLYRRYLWMALRAARLMQQAYNFETDQALDTIKPDYSTDEVKGLLAAEMLMADIETFTYDLITTQTQKPQLVKQTISLANNYPYLFETQLRKTGVMEFQTRVEDFDLYYPGTYAGRIERVEVLVDGIVPVTGTSGALINSGVSFYRVPAASWSGEGLSGLKYLIQPRETLILSDYNATQDALLQPPDARRLKIFEGAGVASSWRLELPRSINDIDYGALTDVRLVFHYKARFDPDLRDKVLAQLGTIPGVNQKQRGIPLRWLYPDAYFHFLDTGTLSVDLLPTDFRANESAPVLTGVGLLVATDGTVPAKGVDLTFATPGKPAVEVVTGADGDVASAKPGDPPNALTPLVGGTAIGTYTITVPAAKNPALVKGGKLALSPLVNVALIVEYRFTPRA
jgi:receptor-binding and translocation channel-forming TcA subunit of Tc toxin